jgi:hypothetical protein
MIPDERVKRSCRQRHVAADPCHARPIAEVCPLSSNPSPHPRPHPRVGYDRGSRSRRSRPLRLRHLTSWHLTSDGIKLAIAYARWGKVGSLPSLSTFYPSVRETRLACPSQPSPPVQVSCSSLVFVMESADVQLVPSTSSKMTTRKSESMRCGTSSPSFLSSGQRSARN